MTTPAAVVYDSETGKYNFFYMSKTKSRLRDSDGLESELIDNVTSIMKDIQDEKIKSSMIRFNHIADFFMKIIDKYKVQEVYLEGYALGARGMVFSIAENTAILKQKLFERQIPVSIFPPTVIKKYATGAGNAKKEKMKKAFEDKYNYHLNELVEISHYTEAPYTDVIDAFWILQYGLQI